MGLNPIELTNDTLVTCINDLKTTILNSSTPKPRIARFQVLGFYSMSSDLGLALKDLTNPGFTVDNTTRTHSLSQVLSRGKSLLFAFSDLKEPSQVN